MEDDAAGIDRDPAAADVAFVDSECGTKGCVVKPLYADPVAKTPVLMIDAAAEQSFGPDYPPAP